MLASPQHVSDLFASASMTIEAHESDGGERAVLHVVETVLSKTSYFQAELSGRWATNGKLRLELPEGCSIAMFNLLMSRLSASCLPGARFTWPTMDLTDTLKLLQLADMIIVDSLVHDELKAMLRSNVRTTEHIVQIREFYNGVDVPLWLKNLVDGKKSCKVAHWISVLDLVDMAKKVVRTANKPTLTALEKVLAQRSRMGQQYVMENAAILESAIQGGFFTESQALTQAGLRMVCYCEVGIEDILGLISCFIIAHVEFFEKLTRVVFQKWKPSYCTSLGFTDPQHVYRKVFETLLEASAKKLDSAQMSPQDIAAFLAHVIKNRHVPHTLVGSTALPAALKSMDLDSQIAVCSTLSKLDDGYLCKIFNSDFVTVVGERVQLNLCVMVSRVSAPFFRQMFSTELLQRVGVAVQLHLCQQLDKRFHNRLQEHVSPEMLGCVAPQTRSFLCSMLAVEIAELNAEMLAIVLAEISCEDTEADI